MQIDALTSKMQQLAKAIDKAIEERLKNLD